MGEKISAPESISLWRITRLEAEERIALILWVAGVVSIHMALPVLLPRGRFGSAPASSKSSTACYIYNMDISLSSYEIITP